MSSAHEKPAPSAAPRTRLVDVARDAGVSKALASRLLNGHEVAVRDETRKRVLASARLLDYRPHAAARSLKRGQTGALSLLIPTLVNPVFALISRGAVARALEQEVAVLLVEDTTPASADELLRSLIQMHRIDGAIVASIVPEHPLLATLERLALPHVFVHRTVPKTGRNVSMADERASAVAVDYLAELGHRNLAHIAGEQFLTTTQRLVEGFAGRAAALGLRSTIVHADFSEAGGAKGAAALFRRKNIPTAIYTGSITQAVGVLHAAYEKGLRVPDDFSLLAAGELSLADFLNPPLTTIRLPLHELGAAAVDAMLRQLAGESPRDVLVETHPEVVVRGSTAPPSR